MRAATAVRKVPLTRWPLPRHLPDSTQCLQHIPRPQLGSMRVLLHKTLVRLICRHFSTKLAEDSGACHVEAKEGVEGMEGVGVDEEDGKGSSSDVAVEVAGRRSTHRI
jgi:hypothetical protein